MFIQWLMVAIGAVCGATLRWLIGLWLTGMTTKLALATLVVNVIGSLLMGVLMAVSVSDTHKLLWVTGFLGSFTTFSAFSANVLEMLIVQKYSQALLIIILHLIGGVTAAAVGFYVARSFG